MMAGGSSILQKGGETMPIRITFHIGNFTITIIVKRMHKKNRHSAQ